MSDHSSSPTREGTPVSALPDQVHTARPYRFNWDPSSRRPGPESVSGTTEGRGVDYFSAQPRLDLINTSSIALALGALPLEWSSSKHGFHAISTVLNNPHKSQAPPKAHSSLPIVPPAELPRVRRKDFDSYLRAISPEWERFERNAQLGRDGAAQLDGPTPRTSLVSADGSFGPRTLRPVPGRSMPPLDSVPPIFFEPTFNLGDPRTFNSVTEHGEGGDMEGPDPSSLSHSLPLLEKFSHYADTVEQHLVREISLRTTSFFAALTNLQDLQTESEQCLDRILRLRGLLNDVDEKGAKRGLEVVRKETKMRNLGVVRDAVKVVNGVVEMTGVAKGLVVAGQWGEALGVIDEMESLWGAAPAPTPTLMPSTIKSLPSLPRAQNGRLSPLPSAPEEHPGKRPSSPIVPLSSLHSFASLPTHLRTLTMEIASSLSSEIVRVLRVDLVERINGGSRPHTSTKDQVNQSLKDRLRPLLQGLVRTKGVREATLSWREVVMGEVRSVIRRHLPAFDSDNEDPRASNNPTPGTGVGLANHLRNMSHAEFLNAIQAIYTSLLNGVEGLQAQGHVILNVLETIKSPNPTDIPVLRDELSDILSSAAELSNTRAANVIVMRSEQHAVLELPDFLNFFNDSWNFVVNCEVICRRMIVGLRGVVVSQAKVFLQTFHQARISQSAKLVEDEQWNPHEVSPFLQHITNVIVESAVRDPPELILKSDGSTPLSPPPSTINGTTHPQPSTLHSPSASPIKTNGSSVSTTGSKHLRIEDRTYFAVSATAEALVLLLDYFRVIVNLSMLTTDTMSRAIEFLKAFNSRTCQVVLGAGAMRSAGLKNITAKHLALASQSLSIMVSLIPYVRETFRRHLSSKQAVMLVEFDKLKRDYQEHQNEIHAKLIAIMGDRLSAHIKALQTVIWDVPKPGGGVNDYMEILVKETVTLHKVLSRYLSTPIVEYVMTQVFAAINHRLSEEYGKIELPHQEAKMRLLADAKFLNQKLSALKNVGTPSGMLETVISEKSIPRGAGPTPTRSITVNSAASSTSQRLQGLLSGRSPSVDKVLPVPTPTPPPPLPIPPSNPVPTPANSINGDRALQGGVNGGDTASSASPSTLSPTSQQGVPAAQTEGKGPGLENPLPVSPPATTSIRTTSTLTEPTASAETTQASSALASELANSNPSATVSSSHMEADGGDECDGDGRSGT